eukprot:scaffold320950_cov18-Tisochrysis_lutea.AAC.1
MFASLLQEEAIAQEAAARAAREDEEASKWMSLISVDKEGTGEAEAGGEDPGLLGQFVDYITARKMAPLEEWVRLAVAMLTLSASFLTLRRKLPYGGCDVSEGRQVSMRSFLRPLISEEERQLQQQLQQAFWTAAFWRSPVHG